MKKVIGGQAVMEGVMMRSPSLMAMAVRRDDGSIVMARHPVQARKRWARIPLVRGVVNFVAMLKMGFTTLNESMALLGLEEEEPTKFERWLSEKTGKSTGDDGRQSDSDRKCTGLYDAGLSGRSDGLYKGKRVSVLYF